MTDRLLDVVAGGLRVFDLGRPMFVGMPQSSNHPKYLHSLPRRHGDMVRSDGGSAANDLIITGTHVGTHIDALAHVSQDGKLFGGAEASKATDGGRFMDHGIHTVDPSLRRAVLLDIPKALGITSCDGGYEVTVEDLERASEISAPISRGDVVLIRTGWGRNFDHGSEAYLGSATGVPGVGEAGARWLSDRAIYAAGADTIAFECIAAGAGHAVLPAHKVLLVESGIYIIEALALEELAQAGICEFTFILSPLNLVGATGSPVRPLAVVPNA